MHTEVLRPAKGAILALCLLYPKSFKQFLLLSAVGLTLGKLYLGIPASDSLLGSTVTLASVFVIVVLNQRIVAAQIDFSDWRRLLKFFGITFLVSASMGVPGAAIDLRASNATFLDSWVTWSLGTLLSCAILTPPLVLLGKLTSRPHAKQQLQKIVLANGPLLIALAAVFGQSRIPVTYLVPPTLLFVAFVAEIDGVALGILLTAIIGITCTAFGYGPMALMRGSEHFRVSVIQFYFVSLTMTMLPTAAVIGERRRLQERLATALAQAESAAIAKTEFLANMSHELRTPLASVIGFAEALSDYCTLDARASHFVERVQTASRALLSTVNGILDYAKLERGDVELRAEFFSLQELVQETLDIFAVRAQEKGIQLRLIRSKELESAIVLADPNRLRQVLLNLIGNAVKFTDRGSVTVQVSCRQDRGSQRRFRFEITDTGRGVAASEINDLFTRFSRAGRAQNQDSEGVGLGLAISKAIVEKMGGEIAVNSSLGRGSTFWFEILMTVDELAQFEPEGFSGDLSPARRQHGRSGGYV
jgi:signal transduction histidine kinase